VLGRLALGFWTWRRLDREGLDDLTAATVMTDAATVMTDAVLPRPLK
jgi:hypothetical protein